MLHTVKEMNVDLRAATRRPISTLSHGYFKMNDMLSSRSERHVLLLFTTYMKIRGKSSQCVILRVLKSVMLNFHRVLQTEEPLSGSVEIPKKKEKVNSKLDHIIHMSC